MDVIGARFTELGAAIAARDAILAAVALPAADIAVRPLGTTRYDHPLDAFVLAGRVPAAAAGTVVQLIRAAGGQILSHRTESPQPVRSAPQPGMQQPRGVRARVPRPTVRVRKRPRRPAARLRVRAAQAGRGCS